MTNPLRPYTGKYKPHIAMRSREGLPGHYVCTVGPFFGSASTPSLAYRACFECAVGAALEARKKLRKRS